MPGRRWSYITFPANQVYIFTARRNYQMLGAHIEESKIAGEDGAEVEFTTLGGAQCKMVLRNRQAVLDLMAALNKTISAV